MLNVCTRVRRPHNYGTEMYKNENCTCKACKTIFFQCQICKFVTFLLPSSSCLPKVPFAAFERTHTIYGAILKATSHIERTFLISDDCCGASVASAQQHNQDIRRICYVEVGTNSQIHHRLLELHLTRVHCVTFY